MKHWTALLILFSLLCSYGIPESNAQDKEIETTMIWDKAPHNAFTDLIRFRNAFYCIFREAPAHVSGPGGTVRIIRSEDGKHWESIASLEIKGKDIRDPKLSVMPGKRLMVLMDVESYQNGRIVKRQPYVSYSDKQGRQFSAPLAAVVDPSVSSWSDWVWRVTWYKSTGFAVVYQPDGIYLLQTKDGKYFKKVSGLEVDGSPNESTIRFDKHGKMYVLIRREEGDRMGVLAVSEAPYQQWEYHKLGQRLGGPDFIFLDDTTLCIGSRLYPGPENKKTTTAVFLSNLNGEIYKILKLPGEGDTGYPGMLLYGGDLWVSYYSSGKSKTSIYLSRIPLAGLRTVMTEE